MTRSRVTLLVCTIIILVVVGLMVLNVRESYYSAKQIFYYRIQDTLDYTAKSLDCIKPIYDIADDSPGTIVKTDSYDSSTWLMFETLNRIDTLMNSIQFPKNIKYIFGVAGTDNLVSKSMLAITLRTFYDSDTLNNMMPLTYIMENGIDKDRFLTDYRGGIYIMKKNIQRQEGCLITDNRHTILAGFESGDYAVVQELLQDPLLVNGRKINIRIYILIVCAPGSETKMYMYNDGFMYYTPQNFVPKSLVSEENITTGYIDRQVYVDNPLTFQDLLLSLSSPINSNLLYNNILALMKSISIPYISIFNNANKQFPGTKFQIYGCDVAPSMSYSVKVMEINKGPDLGYKDARDKELKKNMVREALGIVGILPPSSSSQFIKL